MQNHSSSLPSVPWTEEPGSLQVMGHKQPGMTEQTIPPTSARLRKRGAKCMSEPWFEFSGSFVTLHILNRYVREVIIDMLLGFLVPVSLT